MAIHVMEMDIFKEDIVTPDIREIHDEKGVVESWLMFEGILAEVQGELGILPQPIAAEIRKKASLKYVRLERIAELYPKIKLASVAAIRALAEVCEGGAGEYVHYGSCSPELFENTLAYRLRRTMDILEKGLAEIREHLNRLADTHRHTVMAERSHGQQALPTTFGLVAAIWSDAMAKHLERFQDARKRILMGSVKGAVGNHASHFNISGEKCLELERRVLERMGLFVNRVSFRRHIERLTEFLYLLSLLAVTFEKICGDIFFLQRNEVGEVEEPFDAEHQIGSSTLPQKRNPVLSESIIAWCKKIRSNAAAFGETHMHDSHDIIGFYMEDLVIPESAVLANAVLKTAKVILKDLAVKKETMKKNLAASHGLIMTEALMFALTQKTRQKQTAHKLIHRAAMESFEKGIPFDEYVLRYPGVGDHFEKKELAALLNPENYLGLNDRCIDNVIGKKGRRLCQNLICP